MALPGLAPFLVPIFSEHIRLLDGSSSWRVGLGIVIQPPHEEKRGGGEAWDTYGKILWHKNEEIRRNLCYRKNGQAVVAYSHGDPRAVSRNDV